MQNLAKSLVASPVPRRGKRYAVERPGHPSQSALLPTSGRVLFADLIHRLSVALCIAAFAAMGTSYTAAQSAFTGTTAGTTLPLVNRNDTQILGLTAGVSTDIVDATQLGAGSNEIRAHGARSSTSATAGAASFRRCRADSSKPARWHSAVKCRAQSSQELPRLEATRSA
jgi:hypothetical protein